MTEYNKMRLTRSYCYYLNAAVIVSSLFHWFHGDWASWLRLFLVLVVPLPVFWRSRRRKGEHLPGCHPGFLVATGILALPGTAAGEGDAHTLVCFCFFAAAIVLCYANLYLQKRYTILDCNPSVSEETRKRFCRMQRRPILALLAAAVGIMLLLMPAAKVMPGIRYEPRQSEEREPEREPERMREDRSDKVWEKIREEQEKNSGNFWLMLLRYIVTYAALAMAVSAAAYGVFRFVLYCRGRRRRTPYGFEEQPEETRELDEITRLRPILKEPMGFPAGRDGQIRRIFYRSVCKGAGRRPVDRALTPAELRREYLKDTEREERLTILYEKARYAKETVSENEWKQWEEVNRKS